MKSLSFLIPWLALVFPPSLALSDQVASLNPLLLHVRDTNVSASAPSTTCSTLHMIVARASTEAPGEGIIGSVVTQVKSLVPGSDSEAVVYPATLVNYLFSESSGVAGMQSLILSYETRCPSSKIALLGYSQGAQVVGDVLCGTSEWPWNFTVPENLTLSKNIIASIQMGDPTFVLNQAQDVGNATKGGIFKRNNTAACPSDIMKSYCNFNDTYCDSGSSGFVHSSYVRVFGDLAAKWVVEKFLAGNDTNIPSSSQTHALTSPSSALTSTSSASHVDRLERVYTTLTKVLGFVIFLGYVGM